LPIECILSNQVSELFRNVSFIAIRAVLASKDIGGEFWHLGVHAVNVTPSLASFKSPSSLFVTLSNEK
jgi:hypothetical protein